MSDNINFFVRQMAMSFRNFHMSNMAKTSSKPVSNKASASHSSIEPLGSSKRGSAGSAGLYSSRIGSVKLTSTSSSSSCPYSGKPVLTRPINVKWLLLRQLWLYIRRAVQAPRLTWLLSTLRGHQHQQEESKKTRTTTLIWWNLLRKYLTAEIL